MKKVKNWCFILLGCNFFSFFILLIFLVYLFRFQVRGQMPLFCTFWNRCTSCNLSWRKMSLHIKGKNENVKGDVKKFWVENIFLFFFWAVFITVKQGLIGIGDKCPRNLRYNDVYWTLLVWKELKVSMFPFNCQKHSCESNLRRVISSFFFSFIPLWKWPFYFIFKPFLFFFHMPFSHLSCLYIRG